MASRWMLLPLLAAGPILAAAGPSPGSAPSVHPAPSGHPARSSPAAPTTHATPGGPRAPGLTDRESERLAPPSPWRSRGWRTVFPHAYTMQRRVQVRPTPDLSAPPAFELVGGMRVPVYEQRGAWWRIGGTKARTGWVRAADMAPHARCVMLDARTGRVLRQFATKGQWSVLPRPGALWALADTGLTRVAWDGGPHFWSNTLHSDADANIVEDAAWSMDGKQIAVIRLNEPNRADVVSLVDGSPLGNITKASGVVLEGFDNYPHVFTVAHPDGDVHPSLFDPFLRRTVKSPGGKVITIARTGDTLVDLAAASPTAPHSSELQRQDKNGRVLARWRHTHDLDSAILSSDQRYVVATESVGSGTRSTVLDAAQLRPLAPLKAKSSSSDDGPITLFRRKGGWLTIHESNDDAFSHQLVAWNEQGERLSARLMESSWALNEAASLLYVISPKGIERIDLQTGTTHRFAVNWSRPLLKRNLSDVIDGEPHWEITHLNLTPDEKTLIVLERLAGDPEG